MLTFFRRIRKELLGDGATSKYLIYAIGEIALVVIGILIALQINSWQSLKMKRVLEKDTLIEIRQALIQDSMELAGHLQSLKSKLEKNVSLLEHLENSSPHNDKLDILFFDVYVTGRYKTFNLSAFELLKERGLDLITNSDLRRRISTHYSKDYAIIIGWIDRMEAINLMHAEKLYSHFTITRNIDGNIIMKPHSYQQIISNPELFSSYYHFEALTFSYIFQFNIYKEKSQRVLQLIKDELGESE